MTTKTLGLAIAICAIIIAAAGCSNAQKRSDELFAGHMIAPAELAKQIQDGSARQITILNIGPRKNIPGAIKLGMVSEPEGMAAYRAQLAKYPLDQQLVIYCGCCPYEHCPNVRPAVAVLQELKFINYRVLDMPSNIDVDWVKKGYPLAQ